MGVTSILVVSLLWGIQSAAATQQSSYPGPYTSPQTLSEDLEDMTFETSNTLEVSFEVTMGTSVGGDLLCLGGATGQPIIYFYVRSEGYIGFGYQSNSPHAAGADTTSGSTAAYTSITAGHTYNLRFTLINGVAQIYINGFPYGSQTGGAFNIPAAGSIVVGAGNLALGSPFTFGQISNLFVRSAINLPVPYDQLYTPLARALESGHVQFGPDDVLVDSSVTRGEFGHQITKFYACLDTAVNKSTCKVSMHPDDKIQRFNTL